MQLSFKIIVMSEFIPPALFNPSKAKPAVKAPSPITATCFLFELSNLEALSIPINAEIEVEECPTPKVSYSLSVIFGNPDIPLYSLLV